MIASRAFHKHARMWPGALVDIEKFDRRRSPRSLSLLSRRERSSWRNVENPKRAQALEYKELPGPATHNRSYVESAQCRVDLRCPLAQASA